MIEASLWETAIELQSYLESCDFSFCIIGGIAIQRWGEPRLTRDVDATLAIPFGSERRVAGEILKRYQSRISNPIDFAVQARILLLKDLTGNGIDLALGGMPYEQRLMDRSTMWGIPGSGRIRTCSAEDLVVLKAFANRRQDWVDIHRVIVRQGKKLNRDLILEELKPLVELKEEPEILDDLNQILTSTS